MKGVAISICITFEKEDFSMERILEAGLRQNLEFRQTKDYKQVHLSLALTHKKIIAIMDIGIGCYG